MRPERFELPTCCSGGNRSIQLSYGRAPTSTVYMGEGKGINLNVSCGGRGGRGVFSAVETVNSAHWRDALPQRR